MKKLTTNNLVGASQRELSAQDQLLSSLTNLAYAVPKTTPARRKNRSSRFWFQIETTEALVKKNKKKLQAKAVEHIDQEVVQRSAEYKDELSPSLKDKISLIREFFLTEIAPITLAASGGTLQAREVAQRTLDIEIDSAMFSRFENMVNRAATLKLSQFVASLFNLPPEAASGLLGSPSAPPTAGNELNNLMSELKAMNSIETRKEVKALKAGMRKIERAVSDKR